MTEGVSHQDTHTHLAPAAAGRCFNSFWVWKSGVNDKLAPFFGQDTLSSSENTRNSLLPAQRQWEYHREKTSSDSSNVQGWKLRQDRGGSGGFEHRKSWFHVKIIPHVSPGRTQMLLDTEASPETAQLWHSPGTTCQWLHRMANPGWSQELCSGKRKEKAKVKSFTL